MDHYTSSYFKHHGFRLCHIDTFCSYCDYFIDLSLMIKYKSQCEIYNLDYFVCVLCNAIKHNKNRDNTICFLTNKGYNMLHFTVCKTCKSNHYFTGDECLNVYTFVNIYNASIDLFKWKKHNYLTLQRDYKVRMRKIRKKLARYLINDIVNITMTYCEHTKQINKKLNISFHITNEWPDNQETSIRYM
jgi:hypothetical protein